MQAKDIKHGLHVTVNSERVWEVLERKATGVWWLHRWNDAGEWETTYNDAAAMTLVGAGAHQETLLTEKLELV